MGYGSVCSPGVELFPTMSKALALIPSTVNVKEDKLNFIYIHIHTHTYMCQVCIPLMPALGRQDRWISEFEANLVYIVSSRTARATQRNLSKYTHIYTHTDTTTNTTKTTTTIPLH